MYGHWQESQVGDQWMPGCPVKESVSSQKSLFILNG